MESKLFKSMADLTMKGINYHRMRAITDAVVEMGRKRPIPEADLPKSTKGDISALWKTGMRENYDGLD